MCSDRRRVLFPDSAGGLPAGEITIAEALKDLGYSTGCVGKWHLGHLPEFLPTENGFDYYFGIPYSNDMDRVAESPKGRLAFLSPEIEFWNVPLLRNQDVIERPADQRTITRRYTEEAVKFIETNREQPFFLYLAHSMPHVPLFRSDSFAGTSLRGLYGDVIEEIDWSVGRVLQTLRDLQLDERTLVVFTSDNGPWLSYDQQGGSAGLLRGGKGGTFEGGMREPAIFWWPGTAEPGVISSMATTMDILPTFLELAGSSPPVDRVLDGYSLVPLLKGIGTNKRSGVIYYRGTQIYAARKGPFKAHFVTRSEYGGEEAVPHDPPLLYHLEHDPSEKFDIAKEHPDVVAEILAFVAAHKATVESVPDQLAIRIE
jgi:arylsulfatase A-like enzyme